MLRKLFGPVTPVGLERTSKVPLQPLELTHTELSTPHTKPKNIARWAHVPMNSQCLGLRGLPHPKDVNTEHFSPSQPVAIRSAPAAVPRTAALVAQCASNDPHKTRSTQLVVYRGSTFLRNFPRFSITCLSAGLSVVDTTTEHTSRRHTQASTARELKTHRLVLGHFPAHSGLH